MSATVYCYHCATHHPQEQMRQISTKGGKRWRCIKSIEATKAGLAQRDAFGRTITEINKADTKVKLSRMANPDRNRDF